MLHKLTTVDLKNPSTGQHKKQMERLKKNMPRNLVTLLD